MVTVVHNKITTVSLLETSQGKAGPRIRKWRLPHKKRRNTSQTRLIAKGSFTCLVLFTLFESQCWGGKLKGASQAKPRRDRCHSLDQNNSRTRPHTHTHTQQSRRQNRVALTTHAELNSRMSQRGYENWSSFGIKNTHPSSLTQKGNLEFPDAENYRFPNYTDFFVLNV